METKRRVVGSHAFFFPAGKVFTVPSAETPLNIAGRSIKPGDADPAWIDLGIADWANENTATFETLMAPSPGLRVAYDEIQTSGGLTLAGTLKEMSNLILQLLFSTESLPVSPIAGGAYVPMAGRARLKGWLKLDQYDEENVKFNEVRVFVSLRLTGALPNGDAANDIPAQALVLYSTINSGTLV